MVMKFVFSLQRSIGYLLTTNLETLIDGNPENLVKGREFNHGKNNFVLNTIHPIWGMGVYNFQG